MAHRNRSDARTRTRVSSHRPTRSHRPTANDMSSTTNPRTPRTPRTPLPSLRDHFGMSEQDLLDLLQPADDTVLCAALVDVVHGGDEFNHDGTALAAAVLNMSATRKNVLAINLMRGWSESRQAWIAHAIAPAQDLIGRATKRAELARERREKEQQKRIERLREMGIPEGLHRRRVVVRWRPAANASASAPTNTGSGAQKRKTAVAPQPSKKRKRAAPKAKLSPRPKPVSEQAGVHADADDDNAPVEPEENVGGAATKEMDVDNNNNVDNVDNNDADAVDDVVAETSRDDVVVTEAAPDDTMAAERHNVVDNNNVATVVDEAHPAEADHDAAPDEDHDNAEGRVVADIHDVDRDGTSEPDSVTDATGDANERVEIVDQDDADVAGADAADRSVVEVAMEEEEREPDVAENVAVVDDVPAVTTPDVTAIEQDVLSEQDGGVDREPPSLTESQQLPPPPRVALPQANASSEQHSRVPPTTTMAAVDVVAPIAPVFATDCAASENKDVPIATTVLTPTEMPEDVMTESAPVAAKPPVQQQVEVAHLDGAATTAVSASVLPTISLPMPAAVLEATSMLQQTEQLVAVSPPPLSLSLSSQP